MANRNGRKALLLLGIAALLGSGGARAQTAAEQAEETARLNAQAAVANAQAGVANAEAARINAEATRDKAGIAALGLPSFEGKTTLGTNAGDLEASMLAMHALQAAAVSISDAVCDGGAANGGKCDNTHPNTRKYLVMTGSDPLDLSLVSAMEAQMAGMRQQFFDVGIGRPESGPRSLFAGPAAVSAISALAGLLRTETTVTAAQTSSISERALANAVASRLRSNAYFPGAAVGKVDPNGALLTDFERLVTLRRDAAAALKTETNAARKEALTAAIARFDAFSVKVSTADAQGSVPIVRAARLAEMSAGNPAVLRIHVDKSGGTFINKKNLGTYLGLDPLRVTGAVIASYSVTDPDTGSLTSSDIFVCRTALTRLRPIHDASWKGAGGTAKAACTQISK
jgi:hypothetical protein